GQKSKAIIDLMLPASVFEKFLAGVLFSAFFSILSYVFIFQVIDIVSINLTYKDYHTTITVISDGVTRTRSYNGYFFSRHLDIVSKLFSVVILFPFFLTSIFLLGSIYFNRF